MMNWGLWLPLPGGNWPIQQWLFGWSWPQDPQFPGSTRDKIRSQVTFPYLLNSVEGVLLACGLSELCFCWISLVTWKKLAASDFSCLLWPKVDRPVKGAKHVSQYDAQIDTEENHDPFGGSSKPETSHAGPVKENQILSCSDLVFLQGRLAESELREDCNTSGSMKSTPPALVGWLSSHVLIGGWWWVVSGVAEKVESTDLASNFQKLGFSEQPHQNVTKRVTVGSFPQKHRLWRLPQHNHPKSYWR